jgi:tetratricopeptide (TPR) repeat protein
MTGLPDDQTLASAAGLTSPASPMGGAPGNYAVSAAFFGGGLTSGVTADAAAPAAPVAASGGTLAEGQAFGARYRILSLLGAGGMGEVYRAWDAELGLAVALKVIRSQDAIGPSQSAALHKQIKNELVLARQVTHKNVVRIHDLGEIDGIKYITMPYVEGRDLSTILKDEGALGVERSLKIARQVALGLAAAHDAKVVHRDLKPANIMITADDAAVIMDFGIAHSTSAPSQGRGVAGTLQYMAPEQASAGAVDQRADIYAFGLIVYEMLIGLRKPSGTGTALDDMRARFEKGLPALRSVDETIPEPLAALVGTCIETDPAKRFQTSAELVAALDRLDAQGEEIPEIRRLTPRLMAAAAAVVVVLGVALYFVGYNTAPAAPVHHDPTPVLIADFENRSGDPVFAGAVEQTLSIALEGAPYITVFRTRDARRDAQQLSPDKSDRITPAVGQLIARREGLKVLLTGAIDATKNGYRLTLQAADPAADPATAKPIASVTRDVGDKSQVLPAIALMAESVREGLGESKTEMAKLAAAETFTAGSLDAMRAYTTAQDLMDRGRDAEALAAYERAVSLDPNLGRAYAGMGVAYRNLKQEDKAREAYDNALKLVDRMTDREKYRTLGGYYFTVAQNYEKAVENYETLVRLFPADNVGLQNLAFAYVMTGNVQKAVEIGRQASAIYPQNLAPRYNYAMYAMYAGDFDTSKAQAQLLIKQDPSMHLWLLPLADSTVAAGDVAGGQQVYEQMAHMGDAGASLAAMAGADIAMYEGRYRDALGALRAGVAIDDKAGDTGSAALKYIALAESNLALGFQPQAADAAQKATTLTRQGGPLFRAAMVLLEVGREDAARSIQASLDGMLQTQSRSYAKLIEGAVALRHKEIGAAIDAFTDAQKRYNSWFSRYMLGTAYIAAGPDHLAEALQEFDLCIKRRGETTDVFIADTPTLRYLPPAYYWLARAQEGTGQGAAAKANYERFLELRGAASPPDPLAADARLRASALRRGRPEPGTQ